MNRSSASMENDRQKGPAGETLHPAWRELMRLCKRMGFGELERIKIHDGLPVQVEVTRQRVRLIPP
jgi:hypothetical protein